MTARRYQRPSQRRDLISVASDVRALRFGHALPTFRAMLETPVAVTNGGMEAIEWDWFENGDERVFSETTDASGSLTMVALAQPGWYAVYVQISWSDDFPENHVIEVRDIDSDGLVFVDPGTTQQSPQVQVASFTRVWPSPFTTTADENVEQAELLIAVGQESAADKDLNTDSTFFEIAFLGGVSTDRPGPSV